jgi:hypothetical protein
MDKKPLLNQESKKDHNLQIKSRKQTIETGKQSKTIKELMMKTYQKIMNLRKRVQGQRENQYQCKEMTC